MPDNTAVLQALQRLEQHCLDLKCRLAVITARLDEIEAREEVREAITLGDTPPADGLPLDEVTSWLLARRRYPR
jgi:hypothetical protein